MPKLFNLENFINYIEILKPVCHGGHLPAAIDVSNFIANSKPAKSMLLPYLCYGGKVSFDTTCLFKIHNANHYILLYIESGQCRISGGVSVDNAQTGSVILIKSPTDFVFESLTAHFVYSMYILSGATLDEYWDFLCSNSDHKNSVCEKTDSDKISSNISDCDKQNSNIRSKTNHIHIIPLSAEYVSDMTANLNHLLACDTPEAVFSEALLIQTFMTTLIAIGDNYALCSDTVSAGIPSGNKLPKHVALAKNIIESRYYEPLSLDELQSQVKINKHQLCRDFTRYLGQPPLKYLNHYRINKAVNLLLMTDDTIHSIGDTVGIANTTHFINLFKAQMGLTPQQYRNMYSIASRQIVKL